MRNSMMLMLLLNVHSNSTVNITRSKLSKVYKRIWLLRNLSNKLARQALVTIHKAFIRPRLDYGDIVV